MKLLVIIALPFLITGSCVQASDPAFPSCDIEMQRAVTGQLTSSDAGFNQEHLQIRADFLEADIETARTASILTDAEAAKALEDIRAIGKESDGFAQEQGFVSAGERASYDRQMDAIAATFCPRSRQIQRLHRWSFVRWNAPPPQF